MIKKAFSAFLIILANFVLFAHAVIPHHYHVTEVCLVNTHCEVDHSSTEVAHHQHHEHEESGSECAFTHLNVIADGQSRQDIKVSVLDLVPLQFSAQLLEHIDDLDLHLYAYEVSFSYIPLINKDYLCYANKSLGLRAPPIV